jgi:pimeloyl-ACP methyl ester carboxylesterase
MATDGAVRYARAADGARIAFRCKGSGPALLEIGGLGALFSIDSVDEQPRWARFEEQLASFCRLIRLDLRGVGLSDPVDGPFDIGTWAADSMAVLDAAGVDDAFVVGSGYGGLPALRIAVDYPERVKGLILAHAYARVTRSDDYPAGVPASIMVRQATMVEETETADGSDIELMAPTLANEPETRAWWARAATRAAGPTAARKMWQLFTTCDERETAAKVAVETLVLQVAGNRFMRAGHAEWLANNLPQARLALLPGDDHVLWAHPNGDLIAEIEEFVTGERSHGSGQRQIMAILFTDLVGSTEGNAKAGDAHWAHVLARHDSLCEGQIKRFGGRLIKRMGDGVLATFPTVSSGVSAGSAIAAGAGQAGFNIRIGLHAAEIEQRENDVFGIGVNIAARTMAHAAANQVTVTRTVVDLLTGSGHSFELADTVAFKGVPGEWDLYALR